MSKQIQIRRGTTNANDLFVGAEGELSMDTTTKGVRIHDGTTVGGFKIDTVVMFQAPTPENGYTWARKYSSGWVEQGGYFDNGSAVRDKSGIVVNMPVEMADANYFVNAFAYKNDNSISNRATTTNLYNKTTTSMSLGWYGIGSPDVAQYLVWKVEGMAA